MRIQLSDRDKVKRMVVQEHREIEIKLTLNVREAMILKSLLGQIWSGNTDLNQTREFTDSIYWRLSELGLPALAKEVFSFEDGGIKAHSDLACRLYGENECQRQFEANRDYINKERDASRTIKNYNLPYSTTWGA